MLQVLIEYYEARLRPCGTAEQDTADAALEQELKEMEEDAAQQEKVDDVAQELADGLAVRD